MTLLCGFCVAFSISLFTIAAANGLCDEAFQHLNLSQVGRFQWSAVATEATNSSSSDIFYFSFCQPLSFPETSVEKQCNGHSVCRIKNGSMISYGHFPLSNESYTNLDNWFFFTGGRCDKGQRSQYKAAIKFSCGPTLGSPEFYFEGFCQSFLSWRTTAACLQNIKQEEVPCVVNDRNGVNYDLSYLIKSKGAFKVETSRSDVELYINVCADIQPDEELVCPSGSSACLKTSDGNKVVVGTLNSSLTQNGKDLMLTYPTSSASPLSGCSSPPQTVILFKCPPRGRNHPPRLISDAECHYVVEWETEHACPTELLHAVPGSCVFKNEEHGVEIDLNPLKNTKTGNIHVKGNLNGTETDFYLNFCDQAYQGYCDGKESRTIAACANTTKESIILGKNPSAVLRYADSTAILTFYDGSRCTDEATWSTVIYFICNPDAGKGQLKFDRVNLEDCTVMFKWETKYACINHSVVSDCSVQTGDVYIDLSMLTKAEGETPWQVYMTSEQGNSSIFLNVCGLVAGFPQAKCAYGSSVCAVVNNKSLNYGNLKKAPEYDPSSKAVTLTYDSGDECRPGKRYKTVINFVCKPGEKSSSPAFLNKDETECIIELEWHVAAACPRSVKQGDSCRVTDDSLGFTLDLSPLKTDKPYQITHGEYKYYINVCGSLNGTPCNKGNIEQPGICQEDPKGRSWTLGQYNSKLSYIDGMVNLTYWNGTPYSDPKKTPRRSSISFLCDYDAGVGQPEFVGEDKLARSYSFKWYTSYACSTSYYTGCVVKDPSSGLHYDLSRLNQLTDGDFIAENPEMKYTMKFYISVCRPLTRAPVGCDSKSAACATKVYNNGTEVVEVANAGQARNPPEINSIGSRLSLTYDMGSPCIAMGKNENYSTTIHFICEKDQHDRLMYMSMVGKCKFSFVWTTHTACPVKQTERDACTITDPTTETVYDLTTLDLKGRYYNLSVGSDTYQINICGPVKGGGCGSNSSASVCRIDSNGTASVLGLEKSSFIEVNENGSPTITYLGNYSKDSGDASKVIVEFICSESVKYELSLTYRTEHLYEFTFKTPLACAPAVVDCVFNDPYGNVYDLNPLSLQQGKNLEIEDSRAGRRNLKYHLSICRTLSRTADYVCPGGSTAACQTDSYLPGVKGMSLGNLAVKPTFGQDNTIVLEYIGGELCQKGSHSRSSVITLQCSMNQKAVFLGESDTCEFMFHLETPAACPIKREEGSNCSVTDSVTGNTFNFGTLFNKSHDYAVHAGEYIYLLNICGPLSSVTSACQGSASCQTKPTDNAYAINTGKPSRKLFYENGIAKLTYKGGLGPCHGTYNRSTSITFICDHSADKPELRFLSEDDDCTYNFEARTSLACPPFVIQDCKVKNEKNETIDLTPLSNPRYNYKASANETSVKYILNVCRSVVHRAESPCGVNAGACAVDSLFRTRSLGKVQSSPYFENGKVKLNYSGGDTCNEGKNIGNKMSTVIEFICDSVNQEGPVLVEEKDCTYYFKWHTVLACPFPEAKEFDNCTAVNPATGYPFNFTALQRDEPYKVTVGGSRYKISICKALSESSCKAGAGVCREDSPQSSVDFGKANSKLYYNDGIMYLNYSSGEECKDKKSKRSTIIQFVCAPKGYSHTGPQFITETEDCTAHFIWHTEVACENLLRCKVLGGKHPFDLSPLIKSKGRHTATSSVDTGFKYYINICRPLEPENPYSFLPNAGAVRVSSNGRTVESLGHPFMEPFYDFEGKGHVSLIYTNGSQCQYNPTLKNRARIIFICDPYTLENDPVLVDVDTEHCVYVFAWRTSLVCIEGLPANESVSSCIYKIPHYGMSFNLSGIRHKDGEPYHIKVNEKEQFLISGCGVLPTKDQCSGSAVCLNTSDGIKSYGTAKSYTYFDSILRVEYSSGSRCSANDSSQLKSVIEYTCDQHNKIGTPEYIQMYSCTVVFKWKTNLVCTDMKQECSAVIGNQTMDLGLLSAVSHTWNTTDNQGNRFWLNICHSMGSITSTTGKASGCPINSAVCLETKEGKYLSVGDVDSQRIVDQASFGNVQLVYYSSYNKKSGICQSPSIGFVKTSINFICDMKEGLGKPVYQSGPSDKNCSFAFTWKTAAVCPDIEEKYLPEDNGLILDPRLNVKLNFSSIIKRKFLTTEERTSNGDVYTYIISLKGGISGQENDCSEAGVCQTKANGTFFRDIGSFATRKFFIKGNELVLQLTSTTKMCGRSGGNVTSMFFFQCTSSKGLGVPEFLYESNKCHYIFNWETSVVCKQNFISVDQVDGIVTIDHIEKSHSSALQIVLGLSLSLILVVAVAVLVIKKDYRNTIKSKMLRLFRRAHIPQYHYSKTTSQLRSTDDGDTVLLSSAQVIHSDDGSDMDILS